MAYEFALSSGSRTSIE